MRRTKEDAEQTRTAILDAAERVFRERAIDAATLDGISRAAGVTRGAFYWHFKDKTDLLSALQARSSLPQEELLAYDETSSTDDPFEFLEAAGIKALTVFEEDESCQRLFSILSSHTGRGQSADWMDDANCRLFRLISRLTRIAADQGKLGPHFTPDEAACVLMASMNGLLGEWLRAKKVFPLKELGSKLLRSQLAMLRASE
jgi:TetR/AcrR family acrAB operon transcriptional repressor